MPLLPLLLAAGACGRGDDTLTVASKNFTESVLLGEIVAQQLERHGFHVDRRLNLGGTFICHEAMKAGQVDVYVEYTGTAHSAILGLPTVRDPARVRQEVDSIYRERWGLVWTAPLGFNNTFAMLVRREDARRLGISTLSGAVPHASDWRPGFGYEFMQREDGYRGLVDTYGFSFPMQPAVMDLGLTYRALAEGQVDIIAGNSTDGQIQALELVHLRDDKEYFPPYEAAPVVRSQVLTARPQVGAALAALGGTIDQETMRRLNRLVDVDRRDVKEVAREFLDGLGHRGRGEEEEMGEVGEGRVRR
ncbi:MAG: ABC transporter substrate-binding protein [Gemmatimonadales bacterium]|nr:ABC transporter substrate-binding protein [Gemmatimonadales bacterium]NIN11286.1 ABC transporter substrate-binding protein [Gemmatimonadales bacterium]NIN49885.1 ABC transporter substrate-binding protein [Gemmatimonadales bacterium]NIP07349.1 ABC transporter substrate-binding protein [Gemmatimonadales bacterium]NIR03044.1 ABC transporter substrate-binding protein [Gemmatimonadales bacterium]